MRPEEAKAEYDAQGYVHIQNALEGEELVRLQAAFSRAEEQGTLRNILSQDDLFVDLVDHPSWLPIAQAIVGDDLLFRKYITCSTKHHLRESKYRTDWRPQLVRHMC